MAIAKVGETVEYTDEYSKKHTALVTAVWGSPENGAVNLVYVSDDENLTDPYGRQIVRQTSAVHKVGQPAPGRYWE